MSNILHLVSLSRKAGRLEVGEEPAMSAARAHKSRLILVASDAADNTYRRVRHIGQANNALWVSVPYTKAELGGAVGRSACAMAAITDVGLAASVLRGLAQEDPEKYAAVSEELTRKADKARRRQQQTRQHEKNLKNGKYRARQQEKAAEAEAAAPPKEERKPEGDTHRPRQRKRPVRSGNSKHYHKKGSGRSNRFEEAKRRQENAPDRRDQNRKRYEK